MLVLLAGYVGLSSLQLADTGLPINDKVLHLLTFFALTVAFYWVVDTTRRRTLHLTLIVCTLGLGVGSEVLQAVLPNGRSFDVLDIIANLVGSLAALGLCAWYHKRMLERKRLRKYTAVPTGEEVGEGEHDLELGEGPGIAGGGGAGAGEHEEGVTVSSNGAQRSTTLEEEVDNWDENAVDPWAEDETGDMGVSAPAVNKNTGDHGDPKKRAD